jgi:hypothetical protein
MAAAESVATSSRAPVTLEDGGQDIIAMGKECLALNLRDFQVEAIHALADLHSNVLLVRGTGSGKSAIIRGAAVLLEGVSIVVEPLHAVQGDQTISTVIAGVRVINLDLTKDAVSQAKVKNYLDGITSREGSNVIIYSSPQQLLATSEWFPTIEGLFKRGVVSLLANDEAHKTPQDGAYFRTEFAKLGTIFALARGSPLAVATLSATATFTKPLYDEYVKMIGMKEFDHVFWGPVDRSEIDIQLNIETTPQTAINKLCSTTLLGSQGRKFLAYSNDKSAASGTILAGLEKAALAVDDTCDVCAFTSALSPVMKLYYMTAFTSTEPFSSVMNLRALSGTSTMELGLNCPIVGAGAFHGIPASMPAFAQMLGRVARGLENGEDDPAFVWLVSVNMSSLSFILSRIERCEPDGNRRRQRKDLRGVMRFLFLPVECYHLQMKGLFSDPFEVTGGGGGGAAADGGGGGGCGGNCPFCRGELGLAVVQDEAVQELDRVCFRRGTMELSEVARCLYEVRSRVWAGAGRAAMWRDVHRLVLQLVAAKLVCVEMKNSGEGPGGFISYSAHLA